jgi:hypothetical protein
MRRSRKLIVGTVVAAVLLAWAIYLGRYWTPPWVLADLSMRFTHPELYTSRDGLPMYTALHEFRRRGLLRRGMAAVDIQKLLGEPAQNLEHQLSQDAPNRLWIYSLHASSLTIEFSPDGDALTFTESFQGDKPRPDETW